MIVIHVKDRGLHYRGQGPITVGRDPSCDLPLADDSTASRVHAVIRQMGQDWVAEDHGSRNGTYLGDREQRIVRAILRDGDVLFVGDSELSIQIDTTQVEELPDDAQHLTFTVLEPTSAAGEFVCTRDNVTLGRDPSCDVVVDHPTVSRLHAVVVRKGAGFVISDRNATNAVYIGDPPERVTAALIQDGMTIRLGDGVIRVRVPRTLLPSASPAPPRVSDTSKLVVLGGARPEGDVIQSRLAEAPLFQGFTEEDWTLFLSSYDRDGELHVEQHAAGDIVCKENLFDPYFRLVLRGEVEATDPNSGKVLLVHRRGDFFGWVEAKRSLARITRHVATDETHLLCVPRQQIRYIERNEVARDLLAERHKEEAWRVMAAKLELLEGVPPDLVAELMEQSEIEFHDKAGIVLVKQGEPGDFMGIVRDGFLQVVHEREEGPDRVRAYLRPGDVFAETALLEDAPREASVVTAGKAEIVKIHRDAFQELCAREPAVEERLRGLVEERRRTREEVLTPELAGQLDRWGQGYIQADALLVMDLELCVKCDLCVEACENLHGESRLQRRGVQLGKYLAPTACRHCDDPVCMFSCPTGAIKRRPSGEIFIDYDLCTGVGACAIACPYDNIEMIETSRFDKAQARKQATRPDHNFFRPYPEQPAPKGFLQRMLGLGADTPAPEPDSESTHAIPPRYPIKCDLCDGLPFMGCVHACPTGAALRVDPRTLLDQPGVVSAGSTVDKAGRAREK